MNNGKNMNQLVFGLVQLVYGLQSNLFLLLLVLYLLFLKSPCQSQAVVVQLRAGGSNDKVGIRQKFAAFFNSNTRPRQRPQPQCPDPKSGSRFAPGSGSNSPWGNDDPDPCQQAAVPPRNQWNFDEEFYRYDSNQDKQEDQIQGECRPRVLKSRINEDEGLIKAAEKACRSREVQNDINVMEEQLRQGNMNPGIGSKSVGDGIIEFRGKNGGRIFARESENGVVEILGKSVKKPKDQQYVIDQVKKVFPKNKK